MSFLAPLTGAAAGAGGLGTILQLSGTIMGALGSMQAANYQSALAERQAAMMEQQANDVRQAGQVNQQERDVEAAAIIGRERGRQAGSGFEGGSTSFRRRNRSASILARRDALRIRQDAEREAIGLENQAQGARATASNYKRAGRFSLLEGVFGGATDLVNGATFVNRRRAMQINRDAGRVSLPYA